MIELNLSKEDFKFSCAHMTVLGPGVKERLHGHNYQVRVTVGLGPDALQRFTDFCVLKDPIRKLCKAWDERLLVAGKSSQLKVVQATKEETEFRLCEKRYVIPSDELLILPIEN